MWLRNLATLLKRLASKQRASSSVSHISEHQYASRSTEYVWFPFPALKRSLLRTSISVLVRMLPMYSNTNAANGKSSRTLMPQPLSSGVMKTYMEQHQVFYTSNHKTLNSKLGIHLVSSWIILQEGVWSIPPIYMWFHVAQHDCHNSRCIHISVNILLKIP
jgi:hypothetical protein